MKVSTSRPSKTLRMADMEFGKLYQVVGGFYNRKVVMRYSESLVVDLSEPGENSTWSSAHNSDIDVVECQKGFSITLTQE